jgi:hypothetical protein
VIGSSLPAAAALTTQGVEPMLRYREQLVRHKAAERGVVDQRPRPGKRKRKGPRKPYLLETFIWRGWLPAGRYADLQTATRVFQLQCRKKPQWKWRLLHREEAILEHTP